MVAHEKRNSAQLFCAVPTRNDLALSSLIFSAQPTQKLEYPVRRPARRRSWPPSREATRLTPSWALIRGSGARKTSSPYREAIDSFGGVDDVTPATRHT